MQVTFIRHLPTEWNKEGRLQGRKDISICTLTEDVKKGVRSNRKMLHSLSPFDVVLASTLKRTEETAHYYGYEAKREQLLDELNFGSFEGLLKDEFLLTYGSDWVERPGKLTFGESVANLEKRVRLFLNKYKHFTNMLVFGHGAWIRAIVSYHQYGHMNNMNKLTIACNECITLQFGTRTKKNSNEE